MFKMLKNQKGMTLVELLAVMVIVGIIAAISIPAIGTLLENSRKDAAISTAQSVQEAARLYMATAGDAKTTTFCANDSCTGSGVVDLVAEGYLDAVPVDPVKAKYTVVTVIATVTDGKVTYKTTLTNGGKYEVSGKDAKTLERGDIS